MLRHQLTRRAFSTTRAVLQEAKEAKKSHGLRNFVLFTTTTGLIAYGGGVYYSLRNDHFHDLFTEYVPFSEEVVAWVEERKFRSRLSDQKLPLPELKQHDTPVGENVTISKGGASAHEASLPHVSAVTGPKKEKKEKKVRDEVPQVKKKESLPLVYLPRDSDPLVSEAVESLNGFIKAVNTSGPTEEFVKTISNDLGQLSQQIHSIRANHQADLKRALEDQANKLSSLGDERNTALQKAVETQQGEMMEQFHNEQQRIVGLYNERLVTEIEATKKAVVQHANNKLVAVKAEREKQFAQQVSQRVEEERQGRLGKIEELTSQLEGLQKLSLSADQIITESQNAANLQGALSSLAHELQTAKRPTPLGFYLNKIRSAGEGNELVLAAVDSVPEQVWTQGVLTTAQLAARLRLLEPEIRKASMLPPNAGMAGHIGSSFFSNFLAKKSGNPEGNDVESILARAETALTEGRVIDAVSEVNALHGWPKKLAHDWLLEGRKRSEVEFLVDVMAQEGKLVQLK